MSETIGEINEVARLRCSYAELKRWDYQQVDVEWLLPQSAGSISLERTVTLELVPDQDLIS